MAGGELCVFIPEVVVANVHLNFAVVDVHNVRADLVEKMAVVRNNNYCVGEIQKELLKPLHSVQVEVVCRLVQKQNIGFGKKRLRKKHFYLARAVELSHFHLVIIARNAKAV